MRKGQTTLTEIARRCHVSHGTVSRVLNERLDAKFSVRPELRGKILQVAAELNYRPNGAARAMSQGRFNNVALVIGSTNQYVPLGLLRGASNALRSLDMSLSFVELTDASLTDDAEQTFPRALRELQSDGLLINYLSPTMSVFDQKLQAQRMPSVWVNARRESHCVYPDDLRAAGDVTRVLLERGHRTLLYVGHLWEDQDASAPRHYSVNDRFQGFADQIMAAGLVPRSIEVVAGNQMPDQPVKREDRLARLLQVLRSVDRPTALIAATAEVAIPALLAAALAGLDVPRDLSIVTFCDHIVDAPGRRITTMLTNMDEVGRQAVAALQRKIADPATNIAPIPVAPTFAEGTTLGGVTEHIISAVK